MVREGKGFDWASFYREAFERERRKNVLLAGKVADAEGRVEELSGKLARIKGSVFWKASGPFRAAFYAARRVRGLKRLFDSMRAGGIADGMVGRGRCYGVDGLYEVELFRQKHPYSQWIRHVEGADAGKKDAEYGDEGSTGVLVVGMESCGGEAVFAGAAGDGAETVVFGSGAAGDGAETVVFGSGVAGVGAETVVFGSGVAGVGAETMVFGSGAAGVMPEVVLFCSEEGRLAPGAEREVLAYFREHPEISVAYADEDYFFGEEPEWNTRLQPWFKSVWSPDTFLGFFCLGRIAAVRSCCLRQVEWLGGPDWQVNLYDFFLKVTEMAGDGAVGRIDKVLFHVWCGGSSLDEAESRLKEELEAGRGMFGFEERFDAVKREALRRRGLYGEIRPTGTPPFRSVVFRPPGGAFCSVVIPSRDNPDILLKVLESFVERTAYPNYELIVVDNGSSEENRRRITLIQERIPFVYLYEPMEFNFSAMCNLGVKKARGDFVLLLNDDIEIIEESWLEILIGQAAVAGCGAVGAKLWYPGGRRIQHVGITNMRIGPSHKLITFEDSPVYYYGRNILTYDMIGVTAACLMVEKKKYQEVGGLDETMKVAYNDVDFCFQLYEAGYRNVLRNDAVLYHHESLSRGLDEASEEKWERLLAEKEGLYRKHPGLRGYDPYYPSQLADHTPDYRTGYRYPHEDPCFVTEPAVWMEGNPAKWETTSVMVTIERAVIQQRILKEDPETILIQGWAYLLNRDNSRMEKQLILETENGERLLADTNPQYRQDVEAILSEQVNIGLSGFTVRILKEKLREGRFGIGLLMTDRETGGRFYRQTAHTFLVRR